MDKPVFDFVGINRLWGKAWRRNSTALVDAATVLEAQPKPDLSAEDMLRVSLAKIEALKKIDELDEQRDRLIAQVLVSVPREWLSDDAPTNIDWKDADNLNFLLEDKVEALLSELGEARNNAKN